MQTDNYSGFAEKYDYMLSSDPVRRSFFQRLFAGLKVKNLLDCSCGTGSDLIMFQSFVENVTGSDLSESMLSVAERKIKEANLNIKLKKADFRHLQKAGIAHQDAVVCLSSSICEIHSDSDVLAAMKSMFDILNTGGVLIIDQGQSDTMMKARPRFIPVLNSRDISRLFVIDYLENSDQFITVNICDLEHTDQNSCFNLNSFKLRVRSADEWKSLLRMADIRDYKIYGDWNMSNYDNNSSPRIVITANKNSE